MIYPSPKILSREGLVLKAKQLKTDGKKLGFTNGCFDIIHLGHVRYLRQAKTQCDVLVVAVNSDRSVKSIKGPQRPINDQQARCEVLAEFECVDLITVFDEDTPFELISSFIPDFLYKGGDWKESDIAGADIVKDAGGSVCIIPYESGYSTTEIIMKMKGAR